MTPAMNDRRTHELLVRTNPVVRQEQIPFLETLDVSDDREMKIGLAERLDAQAVHTHSVHWFECHGVHGPDCSPLEDELVDHLVSIEEAACLALSAGYGQVDQAAALGNRLCCLVEEVREKNSRTLTQGQDPSASHRLGSGTGETQVVQDHAMSELRRYHSHVTVK